MVSREEENMITEQIEVTSLVSKLKPKQQVIVALRAAGYTQEECGVILGITRAAVGFSHKKAIKRLTQMAEEYDRS